MTYEQQQDVTGAIIVRWRQAPRRPEAAAFVQRSIQYFEQLRQDGEIVRAQVFLGLNGRRGTAVLEGNIDRLLDLVKHPDHRNWLLAANQNLRRFSTSVSLGGAGSTAAEALGVIVQAQAQAQASRKQTPQFAMAGPSTSSSASSSTNQGSPHQGSRWQG